MKQELRVILLNQYIGAIAIGYLIGRGFEAFFAAFMPVINSGLRQLLSGSREIHDVTLRQYFLSNVILTGFYFLAAYLLALWLYSKPAETAETVPRDGPT
jgi:quinol-cytochrome oxidoreductase complex cytochrome b subunit